MLQNIIPCILLLLYLGRAEIAPTESYTHFRTLNSERIKIYWNFNDTDITFEVHGNTTGWVGIGFSPNGAMTGSDIYIGWVKNGQTTVTDRHAIANGFPGLDPEQNINILSGKENDGWTMYKFSRKLAVCEFDYDREITQDTQKLIWAIGDEDPSGPDVTVENYHGANRGVKSLYFLESSDTPAALPEGPTYKYIDVLMENYEIPSLDTWYECKLFKLPDLDKKHHIVKAEAIIQEGNEQNVHHIDVYRCGDTLENTTELGIQAGCYTGEIKHYETCNTMINAWTIGGEAYYYPDIAGLSIGSKGDPVYIKIEIHYDNIKEETGIIDNSGIRFTYTDTLREQDVGMFWVGTRTRGTEVFIPPGSNGFLITGRCSSTCIEERIKDSNVDGVTIFSVGLHSHTAGQSMRIRHIRGDTELPYLDYDDHFDFNYQQVRHTIPPITLKSGDSLWTECVYNTEKRTNITQAGLGTLQEMCMAFLYHYPRLDFADCGSTVPREISWPFLGININETRHIPGRSNDSLDSYEIVTSNTSTGQTVMDYLNKYNWTQEAIKSFESFLNSAPQMEVCSVDNSSLNIYRQFNFSSIVTPYVPVRDVCLSATTGTGDVETTTSGCESVRRITGGVHFGCVVAFFLLANM